MQDKQYDPARNNEKSPAEGFASVNTHNPEEAQPRQVPSEQRPSGTEPKEDEDYPDAITS